MERSETSPELTAQPVCSIVLQARTGIRYVPTTCMEIQFLGVNMCLCVHVCNHVNVHECIGMCLWFWEVYLFAFVPPGLS